MLFHHQNLVFDPRKGEQPIPESELTFHDLDGSDTDDSGLGGILD